MLRFDSDYMEGAHPEILKKLGEINFEKLPGYGDDKYCASAAEKIKAACCAPDAQVTFLVGGTQTNNTVIDTVLRPFEGVVAAETGHIATHEAGIIERSGHKVLPLPEHMGKIDAGELRKYVQTFFADGNHLHMVQPGMVYISHPTEYGTLYTKDELKAIHTVCNEFNLPLFLDGARLGYGLMAPNTDITMADIAANTDVFYIGGTKVGALFGEAVVFTGIEMPTHMVTIKKQHGALLAKGFLLGVQFDVLFTDNLYLDISKQAIKSAMLLKKMFVDKGYKLYIDSDTNQQFIIIENDKMEKLKENVSFSFWEKYDDTHTVIRFVTSWATTEDYVRQLEKYL